MNARTACLGFCIALLPLLAQAQDQWPQFRGPRANGVVQGEPFPMQWDAEKNVKWKIENPGEGWSAPVIWDDKLFITAAVQVQQDGDAVESKEPDEKYRRGRGRGRREDLSSKIYRWEVHCYNTASGELLWRKVAREGNPTIPRHGQNTYASETPVTDGKNVYAYFGMTGLFCYDMDGKLVWQQDLGTYPMRAGWGTSSSPVLLGDKLYLQIDDEETSFLVSLDAKSGEEVWRVPREEKSQWSSPIIWEKSDRTELVTGGSVVRSYDPESGELLWQLDMRGGRSSASPTADGDRLYVGTEMRNRGGPDDGGGFLFAVKAGANGDITPEEGESESEGVAWICDRSGLQMASPLVCEGHVYVLARRTGTLNCIDAETGESVYIKRINGARAFWGTPWAYEDKVFCLDDSGTTHIIQAGPKFEVLGKNTIDEQFWSTASFSDGSLFLRGADKLYCIATE